MAENLKTYLLGTQNLLPPNIFYALPVSDIHPTSPHIYNYKMGKFYVMHYDLIFI